MAKGWLVVLFLAALLMGGCGGSSNSMDVTGPVSITGVFAGEVDVPGVGASMMTFSLEGRDNSARGQVVVHSTNSAHQHSVLTNYEKLSDGHRVHASLLNDEDHVLEVRPVGNSSSPDQVMVKISRGGITKEVTLYRTADFAHEGDAPPIPNGAAYAFVGNGLSLNITVSSVTSDGSGGWNLQGALEAPTGGFDFVPQSNLVGSTLAISTVGGQLYTDSFVSNGTSWTFVTWFGGFANGDLTKQ